MSLNYKMQGEGKPMLLLHGLFGSLSNLGVISRAFNTQYQCVQIDLPNHGLSPHSNEMDYFFQANQVKKLIDKEKLSNITLIGHSMGGKVAMMFALFHPDYVEKLVVLDIAPVAYQTHHHQDIIKGLNDVLKHDMTSRAQADRLLAEYIKEMSVRQFLLSSLYRNENGKMIWRFNLPAIASKYNDIIDWSVPHTASFFGDTLFIKGQNSDYILPEHKQTIAKQFPKAKARIIANAGHWLHSQQPKSVIRFIQQFLAE